MNIDKQTIRWAAKPQNEDLVWTPDTPYGHLLMVLDFANHPIANFGLTLQKAMTETINSLVEQKSFTPSSFLGHLMKEINNFVYGFGQKNAGGKLVCVAAVCLLRGDKLLYLTYGDARVNVFSDNNLLLLNGAKYQTFMMVKDSQDNPEELKEKPEQMGKTFFASALTHRVQSFTLKNSDTVLIFSDGLEYAYTPQQRLRVLRGIGGNDAKVISDELIRATESAQDDRSLIVVCGPYEPFPDPEVGKFVAQDVFNEKAKILREQQTSLNELSARVQRIESLSQVITGLQAAISKNDSVITQELPTIRDIGRKYNELTDNIRNLKSQIKSLSAGTAGADKSANQPPDPAAIRTLVEQLVRETLDSNPNPTENDSSSGPPPSPAPTAHAPDRIFVPPIRESDVLEQSWLGIDWSRPLRGVVRIFLCIIVGILIAAALWFTIDRSQTWSARTLDNVLTVKREGLRSGVSFELTLNRPVPGLNDNQTFASFDELAEYINRTVKNASAKPAASPTPPVEEFEWYEVKRNDNLATIADKHHTTEEKLKELNPDQDLSKLKPDQRIKVPPSAGNNTK